MPGSGLSNVPRDDAVAGGTPPRRRSLLCRLGCHEAEADGVFHGAQFQSRCRGCGTLMIRRGACWSVAPPIR